MRLSLTFIHILYIKEIFKSINFNCYKPMERIMNNNIITFITLILGAVGIIGIVALTFRVILKILKHK